MQVCQNLVNSTHAQVIQVTRGHGEPDDEIFASRADTPPVLLINSYHYANGTRLS